MGTSRNLVELLQLALLVLNTQLLTVTYSPKYAGLVNTLQARPSHGAALRGALNVGRDARGIRRRRGATAGHKCIRNALSCETNGY